MRKTVYIEEGWVVIVQDIFQGRLEDRQEDLDEEED